MERQLEILNVLAETEGIQTVSAKDEAERLYHLAVEELQEYVMKLVK
jgi:uracil phosphoribosyltransferase